jgi:glutaredoxin
VPTLTLYGKPGCHLCEDARAAVARAVKRRAAALEEVDITLDPVLHARYGERIPVLEIDGQTVFELFVDERVLERWLDRVGA